MRVLPSQVQREGLCWASCFLPAFSEPFLSLFPPVSPSPPHVSPLELLLNGSLLGAKVSSAPGHGPQDAGQFSVSSEAPFAGTFGSKSCSRGPLLCLCSLADGVGEEKARWERMTSWSCSGNRSPPPRSQGCWKGAQAKRCQLCLHPRTPLQAVFANAEAMLFSEETASSADNVAFGGSARSPESLTVCFGSWVTAVGLVGSVGVEEVKGESWLFGCFSQSTGALPE